MLTYTKLIFSFGNDRTNDYFSFLDVDTIEVTHETVKIYSFNNDFRYEPLRNVDLFYVNLHLDLDSIVNRYITDVKKEFLLDNMKLK